jgi:hypothetical protein
MDALDRSARGGAWSAENQIVFLTICVLHVLNKGQRICYTQVSAGDSGKERKTRRKKKYTLFFLS